VGKNEVRDGLSLRKYKEGSPWELLGDVRVWPGDQGNSGAVTYKVRATYGRRDFHNHFSSDLSRKGRNPMEREIASTMIPGEKLGSGRMGGVK